MSKSTAAVVTEAQAAWDTPKTRRCLRCKTEFQSEWSGERVCTNCKSSSTWRNGVPLASRSVSGRTQGPRSSEGKG